MISNVSDDEDSDLVSEGLVCEYKSDVIPAVETVSRKSWTSSRRRPRSRRTIPKFLVGLMMLVQKTDSFADAICCDITRNFCERWMMPLSVCIERAARGDPSVLGKGKEKVESVLLQYACQSTLMVITFVSHLEISIL